MTRLEKRPPKEKIKSPLFWIQIIIASILFAVAGEAYWIIGRVAMPQDNYGLLLAPQLWQMAILFVAGLFLFSAFLLYGKKITDFLYRYRFLLAFVLFCLCVLFEISGSSIGMWGTLTPANDVAENGGVLFGIPRGIRSDEWAVNTPMTLSQYNNHTGAFEYFSSTIRGTVTDSYMVASQPVKDIGVIFRPLHWGYLFLSPAKALAFAWSGRFIALAVITFEFGMLITKKNKLLSIILTILILFSAATQWWIFMEMPLYAELAILLIYHYLHTNVYWKRILLAIALAICGGSFALIIYPAWEIPMAYVCLALLIWVLVISWKKFEFSWKKDLPIIAMCMLIFGGGIVYVLLKSQDTLAMVTGSVYPGARFETGGGIFFRLFQYLGSLRFPFASEGLPGNLSEDSAFFDFAPLGILLAVFMLLKKKKKDVLTICLLACSLFFTIYTVFGFPPFLSKVTLMSNCQATRVIVVLGYVNILLLIRCLALMDFKINTWIKIGVSATLTAVVVYCNYRVFGDYLTTGWLIALSIFLFVCFLLLLSFNKKSMQRIFAFVILIVIGGTGLLVNPVQKGADVIYDNVLYTEIKKIADKSEGKWAAVGMGFPMSNFPIMAGAPTVTSTNTYPALDVWNKVDSEGVYEDVYNRYAHVVLDIQTEKPTWFSLTNADIFTAHIHSEDLAKLDIEYIISVHPLDELETPSVSFTQVSQAGGFQIYEVNT